MGKPFKITLIDHEWDDLKIEQECIQKRTKKNAPIEFQVLQSRNKDHIIDAIKDSDALLVMYADIDEEIQKAAKKAKIISRYGIGVNMIDVDSASRLGIMVANVNDYCVDEVSDHALSFILSSARRLFTYHEQTKKGDWDFKKASIPLRASNALVGLVGFGKIPARLAEKLNAIGYQVISYDPFIDKVTMEKASVKKVDLSELLASSDFISVHVPLIEKTRHLISTNEFNLMKETAFLINTARGPIIDEEALIVALKDGQISGCALDVTETEPLPHDHILRRLDQVILTPHAAWYSDKAFVEIREKAILNILDVYDGKEPKYLVNKKVFA
ncbi:C-terminal binding protein [Sporosarcina sp. BP05]|uniref:C-terminal binding protein n=1 Tax=Sporosarcina sp. BP05 TaxID=2758726 RepID=UPI001645BBCA|nr:C-terminal binding protein [Sporosarcina sp. BP05]